MRHRRVNDRLHCQRWYTHVWARGAFPLFIWKHVCIETVLVCAVNYLHRV